MTDSPKRGDAFLFDTYAGKLALIIEHVISKSAEVRFLYEGNLRASVPLYVFTAARCVRITYFDSRPIDPQFLTGPGTRMTPDEVRSYMQNRELELIESAARAERTLSDYRTNQREIEMKYMVVQT